MTAQYGFILPFPDDERSWVSFCMLIIHFSPCYWIESVSHLILPSCLFSLVCNLSHILKNNSLSILYVQIFLPSFGWCLHSLVSFDKLKLLSLMRMTSSIFFSLLYIYFSVSLNKSYQAWGQKKPNSDVIWNFHSLTLNLHVCMAPGVDFLAYHDKGGPSSNILLHGWRWSQNHSPTIQPSLAEQPQGPPHPWALRPGPGSISASTPHCLFPGAWHQD